MGRRNPVVAGLDVGTYKVCVLVAEAGEGGMEIVGLGTASSRGIRKGMVVNIEATVESIRAALEEAELMAGCEIRSVVASLAGHHLWGVNSHGVVAVKSREVSSGDVERVMDAARALALPMDREVLHVLPQEYIVDDQDGVREPLGMAGVRLEARVHIVTGAVSSGQNLIKCCNRTGLRVTDVLAGPLAAAEAVLAAEERELGVLLVDIGGGTTGMVVFHGGALKHVAVLPLGGGHISADLAAGLRTPLAEAERLKQRYGCSLALHASSEPDIEVPGVGGRPARLVSRRALAEIIEPRVEEIFALVQREVTRAGYAGQLTAGAVLTGGGGIMEGMSEVAERVFRLPVRLGMPLHLGGLVDAVASPMYSTAVGLVLHGLAQTNGRGTRGLAGSMRRRVVGWLREFF